MSGRIPQNFIDDLLARIDIVDLIDSYVTLRKAGRNHQALCPFHDEKTPSFSVSQEKQFYHCFGCGANGTAITFLMEYKRIGFVEAVEDLAGRAGLEIPYEDGYSKKDGNLSELYELMELVIKFYRKQLREHTTAQEYLKQRGITGELAAKFELGFAPPGWENLLSNLGKSEAAQKRLNKTGMTVQNEKGGYYDRFRDRIMFPIRDQRGRAVGFGGRVLGTETPKYLNSPETFIFHKGRELYGLYQARHTNKKMERIYVVEGYMDVLVLAQHGISNVCATLGTAATNDHIERLFRTTHEIVFCFDGDEAGRKAAWRALETTLPHLHEGRQAFFMFMPQGEDPDSFVRKHGKQKLDDVSNYQSLSDYLFSELTQNFNPSIREHRSSLIYKMTPYLRRLPNGSLRHLILDELARLTHSDRKWLEDQLRQHDLATKRPPVTHKRSQQAASTLLTQTIKLLLRSPRLALLVENDNELDSIKLPGSDFLIEMIQFIRKNPDISCARLIEKWRGTKYEQRLSELAHVAESRYEKDDEIFNTDEYLESEFRGAIAQLLEKSRDLKIAELSKSKRPDELSEEDKALLRSLNRAGQSASKN